MAINLMNNYRSQNEPDLLANLVEEAIEQRGVQVTYIVREMLNADYMLGESSMSEFKNGYQLPMFIESIEHFNGNGDMFDIMGINKVDAAIFQVGSRKFKLEVTSKEDDIQRPREGDLIYLPMSDSLWEVEKVKQDLKYYQLGKNNSYRLICKLFTYSHEDVTVDDGDFNEMSKITNLDDMGLKQLFEINPDRMIDEQDILQQENSKSDPVPKSDTFGF